MSEPQEPRIAEEEQFWTAPKLFAGGLIFLGVCIAIIYTMATVAFANISG